MEEARVRGRSLGRCSESGIPAAAVGASGGGGLEREGEGDGVVDILDWGNVMVMMVVVCWWLVCEMEGERSERWWCERGWQG